MTAILYWMHGLGIVNSRADSSPKPDSTLFLHPLPNDYENYNQLWLGVISMHLGGLAKQARSSPLKLAAFRKEGQSCTASLEGDIFLRSLKC